MATTDQFKAQAIAERAAPERNAGALTADQRSLVQSSWEKVVPLGLYFAELFYDRLFELDPLLEDLFPANLSEQGSEWLNALGLAVARLAEPSSIGPCLEELSRRHVHYGVRPGNYVTMGDALLWALEQSLAEEFTPRVHEAWSAAYQVLSLQLLESDAAAALAKEPGSGRRTKNSVALGTHRVG